MSIYKKLTSLHKLINNQTWSKDKTNTAQKYAYISDAQYSTRFREALEEIGLLPIFSVIPESVRIEPGGEVTGCTAFFSMAS
jgi:hypothetical protein